MEYILVGTAVFTSACTFVFLISSNVSDILAKCVLVILADLNTFMPLIYSSTIDTILEVRSRFIFPYFSTRTLPWCNIGNAIRITTHSASASSQLIKNVPVKIKTPITRVLIIDGKVCVSTSSKLLKSFVSVVSKYPLLF